MRLFAGIAAAAVVIAACGGTAAAPSPSPSPTRTASPTPSPSPSPSPSPTPANTFKAELKASNENPPITDAEATCSGTATVTFTGYKPGLLFAPGVEHAGRTENVNGTVQLARSGLAIEVLFEKREPPQLRRQRALW